MFLSACARGREPVAALFRHHQRLWSIHKLQLRISRTHTYRVVLEHAHGHGRPRARKGVEEAGQGHGHEPHRDDSGFGCGAKESEMISWGTDGCMRWTYLSWPWLRQHGTLVRPGWCRCLRGVFSLLGWREGGLTFRGHVRRRNAHGGAACPVQHAVDVELNVKMVYCVYA